MQKTIYFDNAATSFPKPEAVYRRVDEILRKISGNPGRASHKMAVEASRVVFSARVSLARLLNAPDSSRVVFTKNATEAVNVALKGWLRPNDHVVTTSIEHNSVVKTLERLSRDCNVSVTRVRPRKDGLIDPKDIEGAMRKETRAVAITHASNVFGAIEPVPEIGSICRSKGVAFIVDAAQTAGALPLDVASLDCDMLAGTGHKALFGPQGTGFLYVKDGIELEPLVNGGTGELDTILDMPERLESGTMNTPGVGGLGAGVDFLLETGVDRVRAHEEGLVEGLLKGLSGIRGVNVIGPARASMRASLVAFTIDGVTPAEAGVRLDEEFGIMVRCALHCAPEAHREAGTHPDGAIRVSPGYFNTAQDIEAVVKALGIIARR